LNFVPIGNHRLATFAFVGPNHFFTPFGILFHELSYEKTGIRQ
jgi:hypothetical protein